MTCTYFLKGHREVKRLNDLACKQSFPIYVRLGGNVCVDARSILALYTFVGNEVTLVASDRVKPEKFSEFIERLNA